MTDEEKKVQVEQCLAEWYRPAVAPLLNEAIVYSLQAGGKRIRPLLLLDVLEGFGLDLKPVHIQVAAAVESIHTGSLIHDDLPAMDDDDYRRGRLTNHKQFGEATAILAGDSLFLDPFGFLAQADLPAEQIVALVKELSTASGTTGMVAGQVLDMSGEGRTLSLSDLRVIHAHKTGKLLTFPFVAAGILAEKDARVLEHLRQAGELTGLAFQIRDDLLDVTASFEELGKTPQKDLWSEKSTYPALLGLSNSYNLLAQALTDAVQELEIVATLTPFSIEKIVKRIESLRLSDERKSGCTGL